MKKLKIILSVVLCFLVFTTSFLFVGCNNDNTSNNQNENSKTVDENNNDNIEQNQGSITLESGSIIQYSGIKNSKIKKDFNGNLIFDLFTSSSLLPGSVVSLEEIKINQKANTIPFFIRAKLVFDFYSEADNENTLIDIEDLEKAGFEISDLLTTTGIFANNWTESGDGWFYYSMNNSLIALPTTETKIFAENANYIILGNSFGDSTQTNYQENGTIAISSEFSIAKFKISLYIDTLQASVSNPAVAGWKISPKTQQQATGTVKLDKGILLTVTDLNQYGDSSNQAISSSVTGNLWVLNTAKDGVVALTGSQAAVSTQPGTTATKNVVIPTIGAAAGSTSFYAKAKVVYKFYVWDNERTNIVETPIEISDLYTSYTNAENNTPATLADIFSNQLQFNNKWDATGMSNGYYMYVGSTEGTAAAITTGGNATAAIDAGETVALFTDENVINTAGKKIDILTINDWTDTQEENSYVEFGGPKFYTSTGIVEIAKFDVEVIIDVIQSENLTNEALTAWKACA